VSNCCRGHITKSIEQAKPKFIVGLGIPAQDWVLKSSDQIGMRGRVFAVKIGNHSCYFLPTYHPSRVNRAAGEQAKKQGRDPFNISHAELLRTISGRTFKFDLDKAFELAKILEPPIIETEADIRKRIITFDGNEDFDQLVALLARAKRANVKAVDIETDRLRPYTLPYLTPPNRTLPNPTVPYLTIPRHRGGILSIAISFGNTNISFPLDHPQSKWTVSQRKQILEILKDILIDDTIKIAHNSPFEIEWFIFYFGKDVVRHEVWECSQLQAHFLDERRGAGQSNDDNKRATYLSLAFLVKMHFGIPFKQWFDVDRKNTLQATLAELLVYNAADTLVTLPLWAKQNAQLRASGLYNAYKQALPRQATCALTQYLGMDVNQAKVKELQSKLKDQIAVLEAEIESVEIVKQYIKDKPIKYKDKEPFNPMGQDAIVIFRDYLKRPEIQINDGKKTRWSVDKHTLEKIDHPLARLIVSLRNKNKMKSTYIDGLELGKGKAIWPDGKIHCNFNATFTTTGRFSSDEPNMQNWPHRTDPWTREQIVAPDGHIIVAADYGQLEACAAAMISRDKTFIKYLWDDFDTHMAWAIKIAKKINKDISDPKVADAFRSEVKGGFVFASFYGATARKVASTLGIEEHLAEEFQEELWETFSGYRSWQLRTLKDYREKGYVETPTGRRRHHPLTSNELLNAPIQGFASDIVVDAMDQLSYRASTENRWYLHPRLNVHDDLTTVVPKKKLVSSIETIYKTMLTPSIMDLIPKEYQVPLSVTVSIGHDWFHMEKIQKFYSHKDV